MIQSEDSLALAEGEAESSWQTSDSSRRETEAAILLSTYVVLIEVVALSQLFLPGSFPFSFPIFQTWFSNYPFFPTRVLP